MLIAQSLSDMALVDNDLLDVEYVSIEDSFAVKPDKNELRLATTILFATYRNLISSQDGSRCRFYPTCSAYCKSAIHKHGVVRGTIQGLDRLTRCNGLSPQKYTIDIQRRKLVDHVR